eukprot:780130-Amphidinium_carterae.1
MNLAVYLGRVCLGRVWDFRTSTLTSGLQPASSTPLTTRASCSAQESSKSVSAMPTPVGKLCAGWGEDPSFPPGVCKRSAGA